MIEVEVEAAALRAAREATIVAAVREETAEAAAAPIGASRKSSCRRLT
jgi:hypothetical protein